VAICTNQVTRPEFSQWLSSAQLSCLCLERRKRTCCRVPSLTSDSTEIRWWPLTRQLDQSRRRMAMTSVEPLSFSGNIRLKDTAHQWWVVWRCVYNVGQISNVKLCWAQLVLWLQVYHSVICPAWKIVSQLPPPAKNCVACYEYFNEKTRVYSCR